MTELLKSLESTKLEIVEIHEKFLQGKATYEQALKAIRFARTTAQKVAGEIAKAFAPGSKEYETHYRQVSDLNAKLAFTEIKMRETAATEPGRITVVEFYDICQGFDWHYAMSDDFRVWQRGEEEGRWVREVARQNPGFEQIYDAWRKYIFSGKHYGVPEAPKPERPAQ